MVQANEGATELERHPYRYGVWRTDKPADPGYSADVFHASVDPSCYDDLSSLPEFKNAPNSILECWYKTVKEKPNNRFMGTRTKNADGEFGAYEWQTFAQVFVAYEEIAKGCKALRLLEQIAEINEDGKEWSFMGIWAKNRWEWHTCMLSAMACQATVIGFYDSMGDSAVDYCLK